MNDILHFVIVFAPLFFCILFLQSGLDKLFNKDDNLNWITSHFEKTFVRQWIPGLFTILTFLECITGLICLVGLITLLLSVCKVLFEFNQAVFILTIGMIMSNITICCLFMGQRIAKDYVGAANLGIYFLAALLGLFFLV